MACSRYWLCCCGGLQTWWAAWSRLRSGSAHPAPLGIDSLRPSQLRRIAADSDTGIQGFDGEARVALRPQAAQTSGRPAGPQLDEPVLVSGYPVVLSLLRQAARDGLSDEQSGGALLRASRNPQDGLTRGAAPRWSRA